MLSLVLLQCSLAVWSPLRSASPPRPARSSHAACSSATHAYVVGGYGEYGDWQYAPLADAWSLAVARSPNGKTVSWQPAAAPMADAAPACRMCATVSQWRDEIVLFGGRDSARRAFGDIWRMTIATGEWTKAASPLPGGADERLSSCTMACGIVVLRTDRGGVLVYDDDGARAQHTTGCRPPPSHSRAMAAMDDRYLLVAGGGCPYNRGRLSDATYVLDTHTWHWVSVGAAAFTPRMGASAVGTGDGRVLLFGGATYDLENACGMRAMGDTWLFGHDLRWTMIATASAPEPRYGASLCRVGSTIVLHGGWNPDGATFDDTHVTDLTSLRLSA